MWEPKPHVVGFVAAVVLVTGVTTAADRTSSAELAGITVDDLATSEDPTQDTGDVLADDEAAVEDTPADVLAGEQAQEGATATTPAATPSEGATGADGAGDDAGGDGTPTDDGDADGAPDRDDDPGPSPSATPKPTPTVAAPAYPEAPLYTGADRTRGLDASTLRLCGHAALALGAAFDTSREDLNVYWDHVNESGGVIGREVEMTWEDDAYVSDQAVRAATTCADKDPFLILGGIGFDQIPGVRDWAEANSELYLHHIAVAPTKDYDYSFSLSPTVQLVGKESGNYIAREHRSAKVGVMYRDTDNWKPGSQAGIDVMTGHGMDVTPYPIFQNQGVYSQQLNQMQLAGTEVVWVWENALNAAQIINQAEELGFRPTWVVFPFQTTLDILTNPEAHDIEGVAAWGSYAPGGYGGAHSSFGLDEEIRRFEAAYAKHRPDTTPNDILWQVWVGNKILHQMFEDCGQGCTRNHFAGMMLSGYETHVLPGCQVDFGDPRSFGGHHGGFRFFTQEQFFPKSGPAYKTNDYCVATLK